MSDNIHKKEDELLKKRLEELHNMSYRRNIPMFSDFLSLYEQSVFHSLKLSGETAFVYGGYPMAERKIVVYLPYEGYDYEPPVTCIKIEPVSAKFSQDLTHRDFLGSILGLGIERSLIGDILVEDNKAYVFCLDKMSGYILDNLTRIKQTQVLVSLSDVTPEDIMPNFKEITGSVASVRLDSILALASNMSRSKIITYIEDGLVFVNGRLITTNSFNLKEEDIISVRHMGKFKYVGSTNITKKGKLFVKIQKFI